MSNKQRIINSYLYRIVVKKEKLTGSSIVLKILTLLSFLFTFFVKLRVWAYKVGILKKYGIDKPVISIGNIIVGGSGKTAFTQTLCNILKEKFDTKPAILLRGYGAKIQITENAVKADMVDEEVLLRKNLEGIPVVIGKDRVKNAKVAIDKFGVSCIILDDGFQHLRLHRDLDIVLIKAHTVLEERFLLPRGLLREPFSHLKRAEVLIITDIDRIEEEYIGEVSDFLRAINPVALILYAVYIPIALFDIVTEKVQDLKHIEKKEFLAICGIGDPDSFKYSLEKVNINFVDLIDYPDHYSYEKKDIDYILDVANKSKVSGIVTTEKDIYKLYPYLDNFINQDIKKILALKVKLELKDKSKYKLYDRLYNIFNSPTIK